MKNARTGLRVSGTIMLLCANGWAQTTTLVSVDSAGAQGNGTSSATSISADGRYVAFDSSATNLVPGDTNGFWDIFVRDRQTGTTERVSVDSGGTQGNNDSHSSSISADGRYVAFQSNATNLVSGDTNGYADIFVHDLQTGVTTLVSVDSSGMQGDLWSDFASISADGRYVAFASNADNLVSGDTNGYFGDDVFVHDLQTGATTRVSVDSAGGQGNGASGDYGVSISSDGRFVAFDSDANWGANGQRHIFAHDRQSGQTTLVSMDSNGAPGNSASYTPSISGDGRYVAFFSYASNLVPGGTIYGISHIFVHDLQTSVTALVSMDSSGAQGNGNSLPGPSISRDGRFVAFSSNASNLVLGDTNGHADVLVHDLLSGANSLVSVGPSSAQGNSDSSSGAISSGGRYVAFNSSATNLVLGDTNGYSDVFVRDRGAGSAITPFCFGDGSGTACPCDNTGYAGRGCQNSSATGGALSTAAGVASLSADTVQIISAGELPTALSIYLQGSTPIAPVNFGDGLRCAGGSLKRMYVKRASGGVVTAPQGGDPSVSSRSAALGDPLPLGATRIYQVYYRDPNPSFCPNPPGGTFNVSNAIAVAWGS
jgi:hypothetical protein